MEIGIALAAIGAGAAVGIAGLGSGIGVGITGAAGAGVIAEDPGKFGTAIVFQALPQTQAIYGLLTAILLLMGAGLLTGEPKTGFEVGGLASVGAGLAVGIAGMSAIGQGIASAGGVGATAEKPEMFGRGMVFSVLPETQAIYGLLVAILLMVFTGIIGTGAAELSLGAGLATLGCGLSIGVAGLSGLGQGIAAAGGVGATTEKPEIFGRGLVFSVLPETQAIYGLLVAILLMVFTGIVSPTAQPLSLEVGIATIGAGLAVGIAGVSGVGQGITSAAGIGAAAKSPATMGQSLVLAVMAETFAIFGLLIAILIMVGIKIF